MGKIPREPDGFSIGEIAADRERHSWYPARAEFVGVIEGQPYYRERVETPPEMPAPPPPGDMPPDCYGLSELQAHPENYPWYPGDADYCGNDGEQDFYRPHRDEGGGGGGGGGGGDGDGGQPPGDVDESEAPDAYLPEEQDDYDPFDPH